jgi:8-oxo-dGTP diphosphatase
MQEVKFYESVIDDLLTFAVIVSRYQGKWVFCKKKDGETYEMPGGRRKPGENIEETARRKLYEETGAARFRLSPVCVYSFQNAEGEVFGMLYFAEIQEFFALPDFGMDRIDFFEGLPENLAYPEVEPQLIQKVEEIL